MGVSNLHTVNLVDILVVFAGRPVKLVSSATVILLTIVSTLATVYMPPGAILDLSDVSVVTVTLPILVPVK